MFPLRARYLAASVLLAVTLLTVPLDRASLAARAFDGCTLADEMRGTTCRLLDGMTIDGALDGPAGGATYRVDAFGPDTTLELVLASESAGLKVSVRDWRGQELGTTVRGDGAPDVRLSTKLPLAGAYGVRVSREGPAERAAYRLFTTIVYPAAVAQPAWPKALVTGDGPIAGERQVIRVPRGGTAAAGVAASRILGAPPADVFSDFTMVADVQFEQIVGPSALTVRFRYEPEAGGGTGYVLSLDPFGGTATLDAFNEGQRHTLVDHAPLTIAPTSEGANRLVLSASGSAIRVTLDGQTIVEASDERYTRGLIAVGAVTWSDPVAVTFDHIQVTAPPR